MSESDKAQTRPVSKTSFYTKQARMQGGVWGYEDPPNSQKYTKKVHTVCISKIQGSFITL